MNLSDLTKLAKAIFSNMEFVRLAVVGVVSIGTAYFNINRDLEALKEGQATQAALLSTTVINQKTTDDRQDRHMEKIEETIKDGNKELKQDIRDLSKDLRRR